MDTPLLPDLAACLRALPRDDLRVLLCRRPEAAELAGAPRPTFSQLAAVLTSPMGAARAVSRLDRFHRQLLELACLAGGRLSEQQAGAEGLAPDGFGAAARELGRWGVGFLQDGDLVVAPASCRAAPRLSRLGPGAEALITGMTVDTLRVVLAGLQQGGGDPPASPRRADVVAAVLGALRRPELVRRVVASAPPRAAAALGAVRRETSRLGSGQATVEQLAQQVPGGVGSWWTWQHHPGDRSDGLAWLLSRMLVVEMFDRVRTLTVPAEVEWALRGRVFASWESAPPELELTPLTGERHPAELLAELDGLLDRWEGVPPSLTQGGTVARQEVRRAAVALHLDPVDTDMLVGLALVVGLLAEREVEPERRSRARGRRVLQPRRAVLAVTPLATSWRHEAPSRRWLWLVRRWVAAETHNPWTDQPAALLAVLEGLAELPAGQAASPASLARRLAWRRPDTVPDAGAAAVLVGAVGHLLARLGAAASDGSMGLTPLGRLVLGDDEPDPAAVEAAFPRGLDRFVVGADARIIVAGAPTPELAVTLARFSDPQAATPARVYRLTEESLRRGLDAGMAADDVLACLETGSGGALPQNIRALVEDVRRRHGAIRVGRAGFYLRGDDPAVIAQAVASRRLQPLHPRLVAPTVAILDAPDLERVLEALRKDGLMPAADQRPDPEAAPAPSRSGRLPAATPGRRPQARGAGTGLDEAAAAALGERLAASPRGSDTAPTPLRVQGAAIRPLLARAAGDGLVLTLGYRRGTGAPVDALEVEPIEVGGDVLRCWSRGDRELRSLATGRIAWAEATGQTAEHRWPTLFAADPPPDLDWDDGESGIRALDPQNRP
ncbi:MAG TPA: helicase-associated domain-containing protein [Verrucomicrobiae bacterium]|nr:helicase-associated domain-containing protein [Verrucomicrobiae bacterium]